MAASDLELSVRNGIARIRFNRQHSLNALSPELLEGLITVCDGLRKDESSKFVVLEGSGEHFSAGADLPGFLPRIASEPLAAVDLGRRATNAVAGLPQITMAAIRGYCLGGALVLAAACDLRVASDDCRFSIPELDAGIPLGWGGMAHLVRLVGETLAADLVLSCRPFGAAAALQAGFVSRVLPAEQFDAEVCGLVESIAAKPKLVLRITKQQLTAIRNGTFEARDDAGRLLQALDDPELKSVWEQYISTRLG